MPVSLAHRGDFPLAILAKAPVPGRVKTRLIPHLGAQGATTLHEVLLRQTVAIAVEATTNVVLWTALDHDHALFRELADTYRLTLRPQGGGDLGERMYQALAAMEGPGLVVGSDCPVLKPALLIRCHAALNQADAVFLPAEDGGYALVGMRRPNYQPFKGVDWGSEHVMTQTRRRTAELGWKLVCPEVVWDVDRHEDYRRLIKDGAWAALLSPTARTIQPDR
ncbi:TIGR04282 family arsenosugar biosynthesis glycosyltransferase [Litchfieldella xinjiangensis]|uniref:TIGR04282 family arsenosugar biosynthesis glycosyltransferase n=1 Tax=Litchfieldella xinjiangensis TaxID=1166948 RepID=UPI0009DCEEC1|nr:TIGR04282 family arsenosugar biosynthesis glycosyltransferase [Halomonas xinjiangensis]